MATVSVQQLLEAGVHFGHQTKKWNPKMKKYIFGERKKVYIINLQETSKALDKACEFVRGLASDGRNILFVGTKKQAQDAVREAAEKTGMYFVDQRWLGGMLTNFDTIKARIKYLKDLENKRTNGYFDNLNKKEVADIEKEIIKLTKSLGGIKEMHRIPDMLFIIDTQKEHLAVKEAKKLNIPIVAIVDTNCNPDDVDFVIPGNDDAIKAVKLITERIAEVACDAKSTGARAKVEEKKAASVEEVKVEAKVEASESDKKAE